MGVWVIEVGVVRVDVLEGGLSWNTDDVSEMHSDCALLFFAPSHLTIADRAMSVGSVVKKKKASF